MDKPIQGFAGCTVNEHGEVRVNGKLQKPSANGRGYLKVFLPTEGGKRTSRPVHRLVACAFLDNPEGLPVVNHIDGDKHNNNVQNLEWVTYQENSRKALELNARGAQAGGAPHQKRKGGSGICINRSRSEILRLQLPEPF